MKENLDHQARKEILDQNIKIWGEELFQIFGDHIDNEGWLTEDWSEIIEEELSDWDENYNDTNKKRSAYGLMYNIDFEYNNDGTKIRRID